MRSARTFFMSLPASNSYETSLKAPPLDPRRGVRRVKTPALVVGQLLDDFFIAQRRIPIFLHDQQSHFRPILELQPFVLTKLLLDHIPPSTSFTLTLYNVSLVVSRLNSATSPRSGRSCLHSNPHSQCPSINTAQHECRRYVPDCLPQFAPPASWLSRDSNV